MDRKGALSRLQELFQQPEVKEGFSSKQACLSWANRVAPLLRFNPQYHQTFLYHLQIIHRPVSSHTAEPAFEAMLSQVQMAIEELQMDLAEESNVSRVEMKTADSPSRVLKLEPNIYGIGINLPELWKRIRKLLAGSRREVK